MVLWYAIFILVILNIRDVKSRKGSDLFDRDNLPKLLNTDIIELYHLRSYPLLLIETTAGAFSTQTTGLALRSTTTQETIVLQYKPVNYSNCFLPILGEGKGSNATLLWDKRAEIVSSVSIDIDSEYWQQSTFLARINGVVYKNYLRWIESYVATNRQFAPQSICSSVNDLSCFTFAETWETFLADSYQAFASFSVQLNAILPPRAVELRYLSFFEPIEFQLSSSATVEPSVLPSSTPTDIPTVFPTVKPTSSPVSNTTISVANVTVTTSPTELPTVVTEEVTDRRGGRHFSDDQNKLESVRHKQRNLRRGSAPQESVEDSELDRPPRGGGLYPVSDDPFGGSKDGTVDIVSVGEVADYYRDIMSCMEEYQLGDFTNALKSCMSETVGYVHIDGDKYYRIKHRYPFIYEYDYLEYIPAPEYSAVHGADYADIGIIFFISMFAFIGLIASMAKLQVMEFFCSDGAWCGTIEISEEGYTQQQSRMNRIMTKVWGTMGWVLPKNSTSYSKLRTSDDDLASQGLMHRARLHAFSNETVLSSTDEDHHLQLGVSFDEIDRYNQRHATFSSSEGGVGKLLSMSYDDYGGHNASRDQVIHDVKVKISGGDATGSIELINLTS